MLEDRTTENGRYGGYMVCYYKSSGKLDPSEFRVMRGPNGNAILYGSGVVIRTQTMKNHMEALVVPVCDRWLELLESGSMIPVAATLVIRCSNQDNEGDLNAFQRVSDDLLRITKDGIHRQRKGVVVNTSPVVRALTSEASHRLSPCDTIDGVTYENILTVYGLSNKGRKRALSPDDIERATMCVRVGVSRLHQKFMQEEIGLYRPPRRDISHTAYAPVSRCQ